MHHAENEFKGEGNETMKRLIVSAALAAAGITACATMSGKLSESRLDDLAARCTEENDAAKPPTSRWHNLSSQERKKKRKELEDYRRDRIKLYQSLHEFRLLYMNHVDKDGTCRNRECAPLAKHREIIITGCPVAGEEFPSVKFE